MGDIREIIESVHYRAASARYKIYIIDEVHMLSHLGLQRASEDAGRAARACEVHLCHHRDPQSAGDGLVALPAVRPAPDRARGDDRPSAEDFRLPRAAEISADALALITRAAEGSARDATSLLDQAISHGAGETTADQVRAMLGLADRGRVLDLFDLIMKGDAAGALTELSSQYAEGADPMAVLRDLAEVTHWISVVKITPEAAEDPTVSPDERTRGQAMAAVLPMRVMTRMWQMLLKSLDEVAAAPNGDDGRGKWR